MSPLGIYRFVYLLREGQRCDFKGGSSHTRLVLLTADLFAFLVMLKLEFKMWANNQIGLNKQSTKECLSSLSSL